MSPSSQPTTSPAVDAPAESASTWAHLRSLSGSPAPAGPAAADPSPTADWADDARLDELFSAWAEAALAADVVTGVAPAPAGAPVTTVAPPGGPPAPSDGTGGAERAGTGYGDGSPTAAGPDGDAAPGAPAAATHPGAPATPGSTPGVAAAESAPGQPDAVADDPEPMPAWSRSADDVIPRPRRRGRWGR